MVAEPVLGADKARTLGEHYAHAETDTWYKRVYNDNPNKQQHDYVAEPVEFDGDIPTFARSGADGKAYPVYRVEGSIITIKDKQYPIKLADGCYIIRKLTVSECKRLQTVPDWYEFPVSNTQAYKMLGNGWTVEVIVHLIRAVMEGERMLYGND